ncbi:MAG: hypothetical protein A3D65_01215 [Candidatus Lloydbacteria bacterium RIFCSPHIGHO2_02_FULL_50_13]|uniref:General secretion pathway GspH domain-containing protein n=1 Tax=Candidatus Lloydbacteria bacterium RIFCSPHIGHO2_02_FULL_50_13 TaxID=1798661 RepID=A0A1G2D713_9BACT|nr:MAG: hypothetical protein A3D65_01215 [Candidatus Lloydbacteria bacterium RIFCSPHIGHO2_02_FULL_50_13]
MHKIILPPSRFRPSFQGGVTLIEVFVAVSISILVLVLSVYALLSFWEKRTVDAEVENVLSLLSRSRVDTIASRNNAVYGVHIESDRMVFYIGPNYDSATTTNMTVMINPALEITNIALSGGGTNVLYKRWSGGTDQSGTFELRFKENTEVSTTIVVGGTGVAYIE